MRRSAGFHAAVVLMLALAIGANTAIFGVVRTVLLRPLPYRDAARLVSVTENGDKLTGAAFTDWKVRSRSFEDIAYSWDAQYTLTGAGTPRSLAAFQLSANFFSLLGTEPLLGRTFGDEDRVAVLSYRLWQSAFQGDPQVVGRAITLDGEGYTVVGVMPPAFSHPAASTALWTPLRLDANLANDRRLHVLQVVARLRRGITLAQARAEIRGWGGRLESIRDLYSGKLAAAIWALQGSVLLLLVIGCANAANLLLARASRSEGEVAIRLALGASRPQLLQQFATHGLLLATVAGTAGLLLAFWILRVLPRLFAAELAGIALPANAAAWIDGPALLFTAAVTIGCAALFGMLPAVRTPGLKDRRVTMPVRGVLVVAQVALSLVLLAGSGLLLRSFARLQEHSLGLRTDHALTAMLVLPPNRYGGPARTGTFLTAVLERLQSSQAVESAGAVSALPLSGMDARRPFRVAGQQPGTVQFRVATPDYFRAASVPLRAGRYFDARDRLGAHAVVIVNERLARRLWPGESAVGRTIEVADLGTVEAREIVGVVGDVRHSGLAAEPPIEVYRPAAQVYWPFFAIVVRTRTDPASLAGTLQQAVWSVDRSLPVQSVRTMESLASDSVELRRSTMWLLGTVAGVALLLSCLGIYSVIAYSVALRTREIGIRMALGARPVDVVRTAVRQSAMLAAIGLAVGLAATGVLTRFLASLLYEVTPTDTLTLATAAVVMAAVAAGAAFGPARRAVRVEPSVALRQ